MLADIRDVYVEGVLVWTDEASARDQRYWDKKYADVSTWADQSVLVEFVLDVRGGGSGPDGWYIDDVSIAPADSCLPSAGGLIVGNVYEDGSLNPLVGAQVENDQGDTAMALATPDDPGVDDAFYTLFSLTGQHVFTATMEGYLADVETFDVVQGTTEQLDFFLTAESFAVSLSADMEATGMVGSVVTYTVAITNEGNIADTYGLSTSGNAWITTLSVDEITLLAGESGSFVVSVTVPENAPNGADDTANVTATSQGNPSQSDSVALTTTATRDDYLVDIPIVLNNTDT
jgi:hypothetical protein